MAKVFKGKVSIPGDKLFEYMQALKDSEELKKPLRNQMTQLNLEFHEYLSGKYSERTAKKHSLIIEMLIEFICRYTDIVDLDEITKGIVNTEFRKWYKRKVWDSSTPNDLKIAVKKFFTFLAEEKDLHNKKVLKNT